MRRVLYPYNTKTIKQKNFIFTSNKRCCEDTTPYGFYSSVQLKYEHIFDIIIVIILTHKGFMYGLRNCF